MPDKSKKQPPKPLSPFEQKLNDLVSNIFSRIPFLQKLLFIHHLQIMTNSGLPIVSALKILNQEIENKKLKDIIGEIKEEVEKGQQLSEALARYPKVFPKIYVSMVAAGESAGKMEQSLGEIHNQMKKTQELMSKIRGALIYPSIVMIAMIAIAIEVVVFVLPKLMIMFKEFNAELPLSTRILVKITDYGQIIFTTYIGLIVLAALILLAYIIKKLYAQPPVKKFVHNLNLHLPIAGPIIKKVNLARFTLTLSSLLESSIPIIDAVGISSDVLGNVIYKENLLSTAESLKKGEQLSSILSNFPKTFPPMVTEMIMVGEETGQTEHMLKELSEYFGNEVDTTMKNFSTIIEPVIILVMGLGVAGIAVSVIMPMYSLAQSF